MSETNSTNSEDKRTKIKRLPKPDSVLTPTFAASRYNTNGSLGNDRDQQSSGLLQRQCACGTHTIGGGECATCQRKRETSFWQRSAVKNVSGNFSAAEPAAPQDFPPAGISDDFSQIPLHSPNKEEETWQDALPLSEAPAQRQVGKRGTESRTGLPGSLNLSPWLSGESGYQPSLKANVDYLTRSNIAGVSTIQRRDLHQGAAVPDTSGQQAITGAMNPRASVSTGGAVTIRTWGGRVGGHGPPSPAQQQVRTQTFRALHNAIRGELNQNLTWIRPMARRYTRDRVSPADLQGAGNAAAAVVRSHVGSYIRNSVGGMARSRHGFRAGANLLDAYDPADRATAGEPISAEAVVWWALRNSPTATVRSRFAFNPDDTEENDWLTNHAIPGIIGSRRADFELWDRFGFAMVGRLGNRTLATTMPPAGVSTTVPTGGGLSPAQRAARWSAFAELMHEYFHLVEHPSHIRARTNSDIDSALNEGVTDILTEDTYNTKVNNVRRDASIIGQVEGSPPPSGAVIPTSLLPARYQIAYPDEVADVRSALGAVNLDGFKAAYLMGHVEYVGLEPSGSTRTPVATGTGQGLDIPAGITTLANLARASGQSERAIRAANPQVTSWAPLPRRLNVPGWREHIVVATPGGTLETLSQIARQHGVSVADLNAHNRHHSGWPTLTAGMKVLIPPRGFRP